MFQSWSDCQRGKVPSLHIKSTYGQHDLSLLLTSITWLKGRGIIIFHCELTFPLPYHVPEESSCAQPTLMLYYLKSGVSIQIVWNPVYFIHIQTFWEWISRLHQSAIWHKKGKNSCVRGCFYSCMDSPFWKRGTKFSNKLKSRPLALSLITFLCILYSGPLQLPVTLWTGYLILF